MAEPLPFSLKMYRLGTRVISPFVGMWLQKRLKDGKEIGPRLEERLGRSTLKRPEGTLIWLHSASVGETNAILPLIGRIALRFPTVSLLLTTVTVTSAEIAAKKLPEGVKHQFAVLDTPKAVRNFLDHWQPDLAVFAESEIWPNMLFDLNRRGIPAAMINGRMSDRSFSRWKYAPKTIRWLLSAFTVCLVQSQTDLRRFQSLGATHAVATGNVKFDVPAPDASAMDMAAFRNAIGDRPVWVAASTHPGEEAIVLEAHQRVQRAFPTLLTMIVPRHPERGLSVLSLARKRGLRASLRSAQRQPGKGDQVFVFDSIGELGLAYRLCDIAFIGGSLAKRGGQNPIEPAKLKTAIMHGPATFNFSDAYAALADGGGAEQVDGPLKMAQSLERLISNPAARQLRASAAAKAIEPLGGALEKSYAVLSTYINEASTRHS
ncbi:MAG: 3-deoxy-D-manno-octulosonic acid transferase [Rhodobiaceae bacterium]|nr:3-deoxy-D-manno-octulosonic acid transferase [Rhodobiaceae bacterium]MCC0054862.1 3-deoxy-D-manno-octulosonic acid transferase [Rhodobiaceae bacterium]